MNQHNPHPRLGRRRSSAALACALLTALLGPAVARATTVVEMTPDELALASAQIVTGHCVELHSSWVGPTMVTLATYSVDETLKGDVLPTVVVALPGGVDNQRPVPVQVVYPGAPTAAIGERSLLFLSHFSELPGAFMVTGFAQGKYSVLTGPDGSIYAERRAMSLKLVDGLGQPQSPRATSTPLAQFKDRIAALLAAAP